MPSAAKTHAYSQPMTPPSRTASEGGIAARLRIVSESWTSGWLSCRSRGRFGCEPVATRITSPVSVSLVSFPLRTATVCASSSAACPW